MSPPGFYNRPAHAYVVCVAAIRPSGRGRINLGANRTDKSEPHLIAPTARGYEGEPRPTD